MDYDISALGFTVFEDSTEYMGIAQATLPTLSYLVQTISGAGVAGNVESAIIGHMEAMTLGLTFRNTTKQNLALSEPRRHNLELRVAQQHEDTVSGEVRIVSVKHVLITIPKTDNGGTIAPASPSSGSTEHAVRYWATFVDGQKVRELDPMNYICYINGVDYLESARKALGK